MNNDLERELRAPFIRQQIRDAYDKAHRRALTKQIVLALLGSAALVAGLWVLWTLIR